MRLLPRRQRSDSLAPLAAGTVALRRDGIGAGWTNSANGQGSLRDTQVWSGFSAGLRLDSWTVRDLLRGDAVAHRICFREAQDAMREGFGVTGTVRGVPVENTPELQSAWETWFDRLGVREQIIRGRSSSKAFGAGVWVLGVEDGRPTDQPIDWANIRSLSWIRTVRGGRQSNVQPRERERDQMSARFGMPRTYNVNFPRGQAGVFHWTRIIIWQGDVTDEETLDDNDGWGESTLDRVWGALRSFGQAHQYAGAALLKLSQGVFQSEYLAQAIEAGNDTGAARRLEDVAQGMGVFGEMAIGKNESYSVAGRPVGGVDLLLTRFVDTLTMYTDMPGIILQGQRPGGLSTAADGEFRGWYDFVGSQQPVHYTPPLERLVDIGSRAHFGPTGGIPVLDAGIDWPPLWQLTEAEKLENRLKAAQARAIDLGGAATLDEVRTDPDLDDWYQLGTLQPPPEDEVLAIGELEAVAPDILQPGEQLITIREAADLLGYKTTRAAKSFASQHGALIRINPSTFRVARSLLMTGLREAQVAEEEPAAEPSVEPVAPG